METEINTLNEMDTFEFVDKPSDQPVIGCRWVYKVKSNPDGSVQKYKARLVAQGFAQQQGVNYFETYSPVVKCSTIRLLMAITVKCNFKMEQIDIKNAYINSELNEEIYMRQPKGFTCGDKAKVIKLKKSLYGLKQSGNRWNASLNNALVNKLHMTRLSADPCVYKRGERMDILIVAVYVDDFLIIAEKTECIREFKNKLCEIFKIDDIGECKRIIGMNVDYRNNCVTIDQKHLINEIIASSGLSDRYSVKCPIDANVKLNRCVGRGELCGQIDETEYRGIVGRLNYIASMTRPDLSFTVSFLSQFNSCPHKEHMKAAQRAILYLKGSKDLSIKYERGDNELLHAYVDADWGGCSSDRRSYTGLIVKLSGGPIAWESKKQPTIALSSTEAEYMAATQAAKELKFLSHILGELGMRAMYSTEGAKLLCDNMGAIALAKNVGYSPRTKHIDIRHHFIRELIENKEIELDHVGSEENIADLLTKGLGQVKHRGFCESILWSGF